ncbi:metallophosphoesterase [bacterium]|nr:metallophosphoesterase [bacterium]
MKTALLIVLLTTLASAEASLEWLKKQAAQKQLKPPAAYLKAAQTVKPILIKQGGLVTLPAEVPTLILPDLHAQREYLVTALSQKVDGKIAFELLKRGQLNVLCLGDAMHSEQRNQLRWLQAEQDYLDGRESPSMEAELVESLGLMEMLFALKTSYPQNFYLVRGNHEDMDPERPYTKFTRVGESNLVKAWVLRHWGETFLKQWSGTERVLPLLARGGSFVGSHAPPEGEITEAQVEKRLPNAFRALCWSDNTRWGAEQEQVFLKNCARYQVSPERPWVAGHRKVDGALYRSQTGGRIIQINPIQGWVMIIAPARGRPFEARKAVRSIF